MPRSFSLQVKEATAAKPPLFFNMVQVTPINNPFWIDFAKKVDKSASLDSAEYISMRDTFGRVGLGERPTSLGYKVKQFNHLGAQMLGSCINNYNKDGVFVFIAFAADSPITDLTSDNMSSIEMLVTVTTSEHAPCSKHMGIARVMTYPFASHHPGIALELHGFAAKFILDNFPDKIFMMTSPTFIMSSMITNAMDAAEMDSKYYYHSCKEIYEPEKLITYAKEKDTRFSSDIKFLAQKMGFVPKELSLNYDEKTNTAEVFYHGKLVATINSEMLKSEEFSWIKQEFQMFGVTATEHTIAIELDALARLAHFDEMDFHVDDAATTSDAVYEASLGGAASSVDIA